MDSSRELYLDMMKKCLTYSLWGESTEPVDISKIQPYYKKFLISTFVKLFEKEGLKIVQKYNFNPDVRAEGRDWPPLAHTMIGLKRLDNIQFCVEDIIQNNIPGDLIETGVWRGGATIFMRAILKSYNIDNRIVWVADSFEGLPRPNSEKYPADAGDPHHALKFLSVSYEEVKENFAKYGLLDEQVKFLKGWFRDTLPVAPIERLALMRLDGDMYQSTIEALDSLYPKLSIGGYVIIDDYSLKGCRQAVHDFRSDKGISDEIKEIDCIWAYWKKLK